MQMSTRSQQSTCRLVDKKTKMNVILHILPISKTYLYELYGELNYIRICVVCAVVSEKTVL